MKKLHKTHGILLLCRASDSYAHGKGSLPCSHARQRQAARQREKGARQRHIRTVKGFAVRLRTAKPGRTAKGMAIVSRFDACLSLSPSAATSPKPVSPSAATSLPLPPTTLARPRRPPVLALAQPPPPPPRRLPPLLRPAPAPPPRPPRPPRRRRPRPHPPRLLSAPLLRYSTVAISLPTSPPPPLPLLSSPFPISSAAASKQPWRAPCASKEQTDLEVNLLQDSLTKIRTAATRLENATAALHELSLRPQGTAHPTLTLSLFSATRSFHGVLVDVFFFCGSASAGKKLLVPLTASLYVPGTLDDAEKVLVDVGTGYFIEVYHLQLSDTWLGFQ